MREGSLGRSGATGKVSECLQSFAIEKSNTCAMGRIQTSRPFGVPGGVSNRKSSTWPLYASAFLIRSLWCIFPSPKRKKIGFKNLASPPVIRETVAVRLCPQTVWTCLHVPCRERVAPAGKGDLSQVLALYLRLQRFAEKRSNFFLQKISRVADCLHALPQPLFLRLSPPGFQLD